VASWSFPTSHARALPCIARDPGARLRDVAVNLGIPNAAPTASSPTWPQPATPSRRKDGHRNRYQIQAHLPLPEPASQEPAIGDVLALLPGAGARLQLTGTGPACGRRSPEPDGKRRRRPQWPPPEGHGRARALAGLPGSLRGGGA